MKERIIVALTFTLFVIDVTRFAAIQITDFVKFLAVQTHDLLLFLGSVWH